MKSEKMTGIFFIIVLAGIMVGIYHLLPLHFPTTKTGKITIISTPPGAIVYLNGEEKGKTPLTLNKIPAGEHKVKLVKESFKRWEGKVKIAKKTKINLKLEPFPTKIKYVVQKPRTSTLLSLPQPVKYGELSISSSPQGAKVYLDGILQRGVTPMNIKVKTGRHKIKLVKKNYQSFESKLLIQEGKITSLKAKIELMPGSLFISSNPPGATLYLNGEERGRTPLTISNLTPWQPYQLQLRLLKHNDWEGSIFVDPGTEEKIEVHLKLKLEGFLFVTSIPPGSFIYLDNDFIGKTPLRKFALTPGNYTLKVIQEGYLTQTKEITIPAQEYIFVNFDLKKLNE